MLQGPCLLLECMPLISMRSSQWEQGAHSSLLSACHLTVMLASSMLIAAAASVESTICLQGRKHTAAFFVRATRALAARQHNYEALEQRKQQLSKFLTSKSKTMQRVSNTGRRGQGDAGSSPGAGGMGSCWPSLASPIVRPICVALPGPDLCSASWAGVVLSACECHLSSSGSARRQLLRTLLRRPSPACLIVPSQWSQTHVHFAWLGCRWPSLHHQCTDAQAQCTFGVLHTTARVRHQGLQLAAWNVPASLVYPLGRASGTGIRTPQHVSTAQSTSMLTCCILASVICAPLKLGCMVCRSSAPGTSVCAAGQPQQRPGRACFRDLPGRLPGR